MGDTLSLHSYRLAERINHGLEQIREASKEDLEEVNYALYQIQVVLAPLKTYENHVLTGMQAVDSCLEVYKSSMYELKRLNAYMYDEAVLVANNLADICTHNKHASRRVASYQPGILEWRSKVDEAYGSSLQMEREMDMHLK